MTGPRRYGVLAVFQEGAIPRGKANKEQRRNGAEGSPYRRRLAKLRERLAAEEIEALLVTSLPNVQYLTGFSGSAGALLVTTSDAFFFTDFRYDLQANQEVRDCRVVITKEAAGAAAAKRAARMRASPIAFESDTLPFQGYQRLKELLPKRKLIPRRGLVETLRMEKDEGEIEQIRKAVELGSRALEETLSVLRAGMTELEVAAEIEYRMRKYGGERPSFETIVATGPRAALPHAHAGARTLQPNEFILLDLGVILCGYASDMTRTVFLGKAPPKAARIYKAVLEALLEAEQAVGAGRQCAAVDQAARRVLKQYGYARYFTHSTGHGLGREVHELPRVARGQRSPLVEGAVITVEPGVYIPGFGGVRIEDVVVVRKGAGEVLTPTPKELTEL